MLVITTAESFSTLCMVGFQSVADVLFTLGISAAGFMRVLPWHLIAAV